MPPVIEVDQVTKEFRLGQVTSLPTNFRNGVNRFLGRPIVQRPPFKALNDVNFQVKQGEVLGIIGHNGAGKSTLLKILAGISQPSRGKVTVRGRVAPLIEVGAGLVPDMTGRENVFLNAAILGMRRAEIKRKFDEIVEFSELDKFIDTPVKRYSSGMQVRLGFAIATAVDSEILIVDEVLAVGDLAFQRKCYDRIEGFVRDGNRTLLLVSHNLRQIERLCTRALLMNHGELQMNDTPKAVCDAFVNQSNDKIVNDRRSAGGRYESSGEVAVHKVDVSGRSGSMATGKLMSGEEIIVEVDFDALVPLENVTFTVGIHTTDLFYIAVSSSELALHLESLGCGRNRISCVLSGFSLSPGAYALHFAVESGYVPATVFRADNILTFQVAADGARQVPASEAFGAIRANAAWRIANPVNGELAALHGSNNAINSELAVARLLR